MSDEEDLDRLLRWLDENTGERRAKRFVRFLLTAISFLILGIIIGASCPKCL